MGGRGSSKKKGGGGGGGEPIAGGGSTTTKPLTKDEINSMGRKELEAHALQVYIQKNAPSMGASEAAYRAKSLMSGNTTPQLKKYLTKYGRK